jgi:hypothetical protein
MFHSDLFFSVKPLLQSTLMDNLLSTNNNPNVVNPPDRLTTATNTSTSANYANLKYKKKFQKKNLIIIYSFFFK